MNERSLLVTLAVLAAVAAVPAVAVAGVDGGAGPVDNETNDSVAPGERLAGVVGAQGAAVDGEISERSFRISANRSPGGPAAVVDERLPALEQRVERLEERRAALQAAYENGSIGKGEYRARMATLVAESRNVRHMTNVSAELAGSQPGVLSQERSERIATLRGRAGNLTGPETAELARSIVGENPGVGLGNDRRGPPADRGAGNETEGPGAENGSDARKGGGPGDEREPTNETDAGGAENGSDARGGDASDDERGGTSTERGGSGSDGGTGATTPTTDAFATPALTAVEP